MKKNLPITDHRVDVKVDSIILSTTNLKGAITYINQDFLDISGFTKEELIGKNHNIVRHPEMPPAAFESLWREIKRNKPWMGMVKNRCKNGDFYWVDAYVMPIGKNGDTYEYQSVRSQPDEASVERADSLYQRLHSGKSITTSISAKLGIKAKLILLNLLALFPVIVCSLMPALTPWLVPCIGLSVVLVAVLNHWAMRPMDSLLKDARQLYNNPLMSKIYTGRDDEFGQLGLSYKMQKSQLGAIIGRLSDATAILKTSTKDSINISNSVKSNAENQLEEIQNSSTAMTQMLLAIDEISEMANKALTATSQGLHEANTGKQVVEDTINSVDSLTQEVQNATSVINTLAEYSNNIGNILDVIKGIAEQTNLLALNAAIEAARAGEQGRGFAVVADEVRNLAGRTQESTQEIEQMIERIQNGSKEAEKAMGASATKANECQNNAALAIQTLANIRENINTISDINHTVASATEEQAMVSKDINSQLESMNAASESTMLSTQDGNRNTNHIADTIEQLGELVEQFRTL